ncbi:MAG: class I SAM-dependent methyltransferase [Smithella sp.]
MNDRSWKTFFKDEAPRYLDNCFTKNTEYEVGFIINELNLNDGDHIFDIGCGTGRHSLGLAAKNMKVTGIDLSPDMLAIAREKAGKAKLDVEFIEGDASKVRLEKTFDHAICVCEGAFGLYEKGEEPIGFHLGILRNVNCMLKPGARLLMTVLNGYKKIREHSDEDVARGIFDPVTLTTVCEMKLSDGTKVSLCEKGFLPDELERMLGESGFRMLAIWGGTAGAWNKEPLKLDEYEIMVIAEKNKV